MSLYYETLDTIADSINPFLALCALIFPWVRRPAIGIRMYYVELFLGVGFVYLVMFLEKATDILPGLGFDYSTHSAFATSVGVSLATLWRPLRGMVALLLIFYGELMLHLEYHSLAEIAMSAAIAGTFTLILHKVIRTNRVGDVKSEA